MSKRPPNEIETKIHQAALSSDNHELTPKQIEEIVPDTKARQKAINFLLAVGLFKPLSDGKKKITFRAVAKAELNATKDLSGEENLVLGHIKASQNEGIWTKHLKAKTNLHQTIIDRCLKTLTQKKLIKRVQSVQYATRKIYMLEGIEPSIALTGGPWYTDNELDTEFIETLIKACFKLIRDMSYPKRGSKYEGALYPISNSPQYPTAQHVRNTLRQARLTETDLTVEHVEMLLNVLVLDGEIEKIPAFGIASWNTNSVNEDDSGDETDNKKKTKKRKHRSSDSDGEDNTSKRKRKKRATTDDSDSDDLLPKKSKKRRRDGDSGSDVESTKRRKKKVISDDEATDSDVDTKKKRRRAKSKKYDSSSESDSSDSEMETRRHSRKSSKLRHRSSSPVPGFSDSEDGIYVYRAIRQERLSLGWSESPCAKCPSFEFCKDGGPVNPRECVYYGDWLTGGPVAEIEDTA
ncbi:RNA polymerase Rpc34 subunit-domain-containing protein [Desarmillaria tabescens]|uniref:RNA polymerase Rpc34 subunit-domain-containing protein n=1 Tax=Armillaria tabescens TaxID=1929756 RepID=A0AA39NM14_ARMTA|nr:RNA polymerase Rpc34 subunit-domain-containing protein [Desarmillaria tabescens]KAK0468096.1 RNA polymerase Rpc34 subunit-domain-containing protein [Desarmillaria tabescens]